MNPLKAGLPSSISHARSAESAEALQKAHGLDKSAAAQAARAARKLEGVEGAPGNGQTELQQATRGRQRAELELEAAATVALSGATHVATTYSRPNTSLGEVQDGSLVIGDDSSVHINSRVTGSITSGSLVIGDDSSVHINSRVTGSITSGSLIIGDNSSVHVNSRVSDAVISGSLVIGDNSFVHISSRVSDAVTSGSLVIGDNSSVHVNTRVADSVISSSLVAPERLMQGPSERRSLGPERSRRDYMDLAENQVDKRRRLASADPAESERSGVVYVDPRLRMMSELIESTLENTRSGELNQEKSGRENALRAHSPGHSEKTKNEPNGPEHGRSIHLRADIFG